MGDIVEFLRARYREEEEIARSASLARESVNRWVYVESRYPPSLVQVDAPVRTRDVAEVPRPGPAQHIARHDPARVLREVEAKWRRLEAYAAMKAGTLFHVNEYAEHQAIIDEYERYILPGDAAPYVDHPDFNPEWPLAREAHDG